MDIMEIQKMTGAAKTTALNSRTNPSNQRSTTVSSSLLSLSSHNEEVHSQARKLLSSSSSLDIPSTLASDLHFDSNVLHEVVIKKFNRTSSGKIYEKDLKDIFAMLIVSLNLSKSSATSAKSRSSSSPFTRIRLIPVAKKYSYSFQLSNAIDQMAHLRVEINFSSTVTCLSYSFQPEIAFTLINQFYKAKLLHSPADRTRAEPKLEVWLQPTPKGLSIVQSFCAKVGIKKSNMPEILLQSLYNSMQLFHFDRDQITDKVIYSLSLIHLLFTRLLGPYPNVWSPMNKPDPISCMSNRGGVIFGNEAVEVFKTNGSGHFHEHMTPEFTLYPADPFRFSEYRKNTFSSSRYSGEDLSNLNVSEVSPYHHRYFSNPESDAHIQYYVSSVGVRLYKEKNLDGINPPGPLCYRIRGKAIVQWLMDCTDLVKPKHALEIANLFLSQKLIGACTADDECAPFDRDQDYRLDDKGIELCPWRKVPTTRSVSSSLWKQNPFRPEVTLDNIMQDPGLKFQFKSHLEREFCLENFDAYCQLQLFKANLKLWNDLSCVSHHEEDVSLNQKSEQHRIILRDTCMSIAYQIYNTYISHESPFVLNIEYSLRSKVVKLLTRFSNDEIGNSGDLKPYMKTPTEESSLETIDTTREKLRATDSRKSNSSGDTNPDELLKELADLFDEVSAHLYKMMSVDSLPKFLNSLDKI
ncbi:SST2 [Candida margitis]|uniref:SST2 n=1 Tax=Candida margitis TaxID=1775924 RepID=UPI00222620A0|nr:SST2 [Candida margitis]KAI5962015.1 SST2 [Candida margitis]